MERMASLSQLLVVGQDRAAVTGIEILARLKTEAARITPRPYFAASPFSEVRLASIFDHFHLSALRHRQRSVQIGGRPAKVHRNNHRGSVRNGRVNFVGIDLKRLHVRIDEDGQGILKENNVQSRHKGIGWKNDLIPWPYA